MPLLIQSRQCSTAQGVVQACDLCNALQPRTTDPWKYGGTGLGLALVKRLVESLHGSIHAESSHKQVTFVLQLPLALSVDPPNEWMPDGFNQGDC